MIKKNIVLAVILLTSVLHAQDAKSLLDEVSKKVKSYDNVVINFKYALNNPTENVSQETRGDVTLSKDKYILSIMGTERMYDGKRLYVIVPEDEEINISSVDESESSFTPSKMLSFFEEGYTYKMDIEQNVNGRKIQFVKLIPIDANSEFKEVLLGIDKQTKHIYKMLLIQKNNTNITITVNSFKTNQTLSNTLFVFDKSKYENYYINNLDE